MALDEFIYGRFVRYFKNKKEASKQTSDSLVKLSDISARLTIIARAITGNSIEIYPAEREGGYKNTSFFLPLSFGMFPSLEQNLTFYLFRVLYLSEQHRLNLNWSSDENQSTQLSRQAAMDSSEIVLKNLLREYPPSVEMFDSFKKLLSEQSIEFQEIDYSWLVGKWMVNDKGFDPEKRLEQFDEKVKAVMPGSPQTTLKAKAVEEIKSITVDKKQQEDYVLNHNFEKVETADEFNGVWRDFDGSDELEKHQEALDELNMKFTVRVDDPTHSVYQADFIENTTISESSELEMEGDPILYDEWDYKKRAYKPHYCKLYTKRHFLINTEYYKNTLTENRSTLDGLRKMLTHVNNKLQQIRKQTQGTDFDIDTVTDLFVDVHSGHTPTEKIYLSNRKKEKDISILLLLDISLSSDAYSDGNRIIDVEKQVAILFGEILNEFSIDFSIDCFYSKTRNFSNYLSLKSFDEDWNKAKFKVGSVQPAGYTRIGTALRHSGSLLKTRQTRNKWVILLSDGKPNDFDRYEGKYGINDVKQALRELKENQINAYALAIESTAKYYLPQMFGQNHYQILSSPVELITSLVKLYERIKFQS
ncbi:MAG: VWA domain-containing protein [Bacteroidales bacterium]|nr:VWA domain-containing protein [Bacteroidales bacterium]